MDLHGGNVYKIEKELKINKDDIIDFSYNTNPLGVSKKLKKQMFENFSMIERYPDPDYTELRSALTEYTGTPGDTLLLGNGAAELIFLFARTLLPKKALMVAPTFVEYAIALRRMKTDITYFRLREQDDFRLNVDELKKELSKSSYDLLVICNPNNPTSGYIDTSVLADIIAHAGRKNTIVMLDESFIEFIDPKLAKTNITFFSKFKNLFILRSLTKFFSIPGLRLGYALSFNKELTKKMERDKEPWSINQFADLAGRILLKDTKYINDTIKYVNTEREFLYSSLSKIDWLKVYKPDANFLLTKILSEKTSSGLKLDLLKQKIHIRDASNFKFLNNKFIRLAVKDRKSNEVLLKSLKKL